MRITDVKAELNKLKKARKEVASKLEQYNQYKGLSFVSKNKKGRRESYLNLGNGKRKYLVKKDAKMIIGISLYKYYCKLETCIDRDIKAINDFLKSYTDWDSVSVLNSIGKSYRPHVEAELTGSSQERKEAWKKQMEKQKEKHPAPHPENLTIPTNDGTLVRSKSEALIYNLLLLMNLTFVYEAPLILSDGSVVHPDFTILRDDTRLLYIEHDGAFKNQKKANGTAWKMWKYYNEGMSFYEDILFTFDEPSGGVDILKIRRLIEQCLEN